MRSLPRTRRADASRAAPVPARGHPALAASLLRVCLLSRDACTRIQGSFQLRALSEMAQRGGAERVEARFDSAKGLAALVGTLRRSKPISGELRASAHALELLAQTSSVSTVVRMPKPALRRFEHSTDPPSALRVGTLLHPDHTTAA